MGSKMRSYLILSLVTNSFPYHSFLRPSHQLNPSVALSQSVSICFAASDNSLHLLRRPQDGHPIASYCGR